MTDMPHCTLLCKHAIIKGEKIICRKYKKIPDKIYTGNKKCKDYERMKK